jgi:hypothetical protein
VGSWGLETPLSFPFRLPSSLLLFSLSSSLFLPLVNAQRRRERLTETEKHTTDLVDVSLED